MRTAEAFQVLGLDASMTPAAVSDAVLSANDAQEESLGRLDRQYYQAAGDLASSVVAFIAAHEGEIALPPSRDIRER